MFFKSCVLYFLCDSIYNLICKEGVGFDVICDIWCCDEKDNCNVGLVLYIGGFILLLCVLVLLLGFVFV